MLFLKILCSWHGTVLPLVLTKPVYYGVVAVHIFFNLGLMICPDVAKHCSDGISTCEEIAEVCPDGTSLVIAAGVAENIKYTLLSAPVSLYVFFVVFYAGQCSWQ